MIDKLSDALSFQQEALNLRHQRQQVLSSNIANADTPKYKARDFDFAGELSRVMKEGRGDSGGLPLARTSDRHLGGSVAGSASPVDLKYRIPDQASLDGNTVDMDRERAQFADNSVRYQATLTMLNSRIQGLKSAMQPE